MKDASEASMPRHWLPGAAQQREAEIRSALDCLDSAASADLVES
ncbi:MAG: hypothetical protein FD127_2553, partial [Acidimicrobiaceae bacterium]